ncbi:hypothetical protein BH20ACT2_BH20ACT2_17010 [soil metagenome]
MRQMARCGLVVLVLLAVATPTARAADFTDVAPGTPHAAGIAYVTDAGITAGCGDGTSFCPDAVVTRAQMASFLARALDLAPVSEQRFSDTGGNVHEPNINAVADAGIAAGPGDGTFRPEDPVGRDQMASFLARALGLAPVQGQRFSDTGGNVHEPNINAVADAGIAAGPGDGTYRPGDGVSRAQMATFLFRGFGGGQPPPPASGRVRVVGNQLIGASGAPLQLQGVNRQSTEYACFFGYGFANGPLDLASVQSMATWGINAVRVPMNEDCWLGTKAGLDPQWTGAAYRAAINDYVRTVTGQGMVAILDLHWSAPAGEGANGQDPMANADHSLTFWSQVANQFKDDGLVLFDLFNEPYLDRDATVANPWDCWLDGCTARRANADQAFEAGTFEAAGMQDLLDAVRATGATNPVLIGGLSYTQDFSEYLAHLPDDPLDQIVFSHHAYPGNTCGLDDNPCRAAQAAMAQTLPFVAGEFGRVDCTATGIESYLDFVDGFGGSYVAWAWITHEDTPGQPVCGVNAYDLITDFGGTPTTVGAAVRSHYLNQ